MAEEVHHHHHPTADGGGGPGWIVALLVVVVLLAVVWFAFLRGGVDTGPNVPEQIEIDVNAPEPPPNP
jgi:hypothetical protein